MSDPITPEAQPTDQQIPPQTPAPTGDAELKAFALDGDGKTVVDLTTAEGRGTIAKTIRDLKFGLQNAGQKRNERIAQLERVLESAGYDPKTGKRREAPAEPRAPAAKVTAESILDEYLGDPDTKALVDENPELKAILKNQARREAALLERVTASRQPQNDDERPLTANELEVRLEWDRAQALPDFRTLAVTTGKMDFNAGDEFQQFTAGRDALMAAHADACERADRYIPVTEFLSEMSKRLTPAPQPTAAAPVNLNPPGGPQPPPAPGRPGSPAPGMVADPSAVAGMTDAQWKEHIRTKYGVGGDDTDYVLGGSRRRMVSQPR